VGGVLKIKGRMRGGKQAPPPSPSPKREGSSYSLKWRELFED